MSDYLSKRILEIIPAFLVWIALLFPVIFSFIAPGIVAIFVLCFDLYWLLKAVLMAVHTVFGYIHIKKETQVDWLSKCQKIKRLEVYKKELSENIIRFEKDYPLLKSGILSKIFLRKIKNQHSLLKEEYQEILELEKHKNELKKWDEVFNLVLLAIYRESLETLEASIDSYLNSAFPKNKIILVLAMEERAGEEAKEKARILKDKYNSEFFDFLVSFHPDGILGEVKAKGANVDWAARQIIKPYLDKKKIPYENVIVSTFDADTRTHPQYFACLTYKYITTLERSKRSFQPIPIYANNIWDAPAFMRVVAWGASFWQMIESTRTYRLTNFSSHAMGFKMLTDIDFWDKTIVNEDSRQFWRAYFKFNGDHRVIPIFTPVYMDAVLAKSYLRTFKNQYKQKQRWAYGVEHFPYIVKEFIKNKKIPFSSKFVWIFRTLEGHFSWATASVFIATAGWMPILLNPYFKFDVLFLSFPLLASRILTISWIGIIGAMIISLSLLPSKPKHYNWLRNITMAFQWILMPISVLIFGSIPAIDAQTRLALGRYLEFWVTEKAVRPKEVKI